jgi:hypothetical protein
MTSDKRTEYLRGIAASAPERKQEYRLVQQNVLKAVFDEIANPNDWRQPINAVVTIHRTSGIHLGLYTDAITYFTGTVPSIFIVEDWTKECDFAKFRIVSEGYLLGPAGA